jgi:hypothetical protein
MRQKRLIPAEKGNSRTGGDNYLKHIHTELQHAISHRENPTRHKTSSNSG